MTLPFAPPSVLCPHCSEELNVLVTRAPGTVPTFRTACVRCQKAWELTLPTVTATEVSYSQDRDSLEP